MKDAMATLAVILALSALHPAVASTPAVIFSGPGESNLASVNGNFVREAASSNTTVYEGCAGLQAGTEHSLPVSPENVNWGFFYNGLEPALYVSSGDTVDMEMATHEAGNAYDLMVKGDPAMEAVYNWTQQGQAVPFRGATGSGDGVHILTGPIHVCGAEPGDVLQVDILDLQPRPNPATGRTFGSNTAASWGFHQRAGFLDGDVREVVHIYEVIKDQNGSALYAVPDHSFRIANKAQNYYAAVTPCTTAEGEVPNASPEGMAMWTNANYTYGNGVGTLPCVNGTQSWPGAAYPGLLMNHQEKDFSVRGKWRSPANLHIGNMGVASSAQIATSSIPPAASTGGNMDNRRMGVGASVYYPVQVAGAMLSAGDAHIAQGDSELDGTGIETSINGKFKLTLHKQNALPLKLQGLNTILMENSNEYIIHGFTVNDYLSELGPNAQNLIFNMSSLDKAMIVTYNNTRRFLINTFNLTENEAISAMTVGVDFGVSQVVDGSWGMFALIPKYLFDFSITPNGGYMPTTMSGSSMPTTQYIEMVMNKTSVPTYLAESA